MAIRLFIRKKETINNNLTARVDKSGTELFFHNKKILEMNRGDSIYLYVCNSCTYAVVRCNQGIAGLAHRTQFIAQIRNELADYSLQEENIENDTVENPQNDSHSAGLYNNSKKFFHFLEIYFPKGTKIES